jgi:hypothetical protein
MSGVRLFGYLRDHSGVKAHEVATTSDEVLADRLSWISSDWRDDPDWPCVAIGTMTIEREPADKFASAQVALLRKKRVEIVAAAEAAAVEIDRQINSLLAINNEA